jgi:hypothetical protein
MTLRLNRTAAAALALAAALIAVAAAPLPPASASSATLTGADIAWPECSRRDAASLERTPVKPMPAAGTRLLLIGLTAGPAFSANQCLSAQVAWAKSHHVYAAAYAVTVPPLPTQVRQYATAGPYRTRDSRGSLSNFGWAQARYNIATMRKVGLTSPVVWIDVEFYKKTPWSKSVVANRAVLEGAARAYRAAGYRVGVYSTGYQWRSIFGSARYGMPEWHTTGQSSLATARRECGRASFQGGPVVLSQWWIPSKDFDLVCSRYSSRSSLTAYFHTY